jgi:prolyl oligopeptidase PreP (S9A serine peptidase family)
VLIQPNVRGSSGFGKSFLALDNGFKREDSVRDIGALLDWIAKQPELDASRVVVVGGSYGGYMSLAVVHYSDRIAGAIDVVGISHFVTFLNNTESYRRDLRRVEYGDERDPAMRALPGKISPLSNAHRIKQAAVRHAGQERPARALHRGRADRGARCASNGTPVWYLRADNEGHGFAKKEQRTATAADHAEVRPWRLLFEQSVFPYCPELSGQRPRDGRCRSSGVGLSVLP